MSWALLLLLLLSISPRNAELDTGMPCSSLWQLYERVLLCLNMARKIDFFFMFLKALPSTEKCVKERERERGMNYLKKHFSQSFPKLFLAKLKQGCGNNCLLKGPTAIHVRKSEGIS